MKKILIPMIIVFLASSCNSSDSQVATNSTQQTVNTNTTTQDTAAQIQQLQQEVQSLKNQKPQTIIKEVPSQQTQSNQNNEITASEINLYISSVGQVWCYGDSPTAGSGSLWLNSKTNEYSILTNRHVITTNNCKVQLDEGNNKLGFYNLDTSNILAYNSYTDIAVLKITGATPGINSYPLAEFSTIGKLRMCPNDIPQGSPVDIIGYPISARKENQYGPQWFRTITNGIISGLDSSLQKPLGQEPYKNYFVSTKIDSGNSGGIAISKNSDGLCLLGIPTWVNVGNYDTQGIVQNINNAIYIGN